MNAQSAYFLHCLCSCPCRLYTHSKSQQLLQCAFFIAYDPATPNWTNTLNPSNHVHWSGHLTAMGSSPGRSQGLQKGKKDNNALPEWRFTVHFGCTATPRGFHCNAMPHLSSPLQKRRGDCMGGTQNNRQQKGCEPQETSPVCGDRKQT